MISSLKASFMPSARDCSVPHGPVRFGPIRFCMRPTTLRSNTIANSVITTRNTKTPTTLIRTIQNGVPPKPGTSGVTVHLLGRRDGASRANGHRVSGDGPEAGPYRATARIGRQPHDVVGQIGDLGREP